MPGNIASNVNAYKKLKVENLVRDSLVRELFSI